MDWQWRRKPASVRQTRRPHPRPPPEWKAFLRNVGRKRRALESRPGGPAAPYPRPFLARVTQASFRLDGIDVTDREVANAVARGPAGRAFRSRMSQRLRNHVAILRHIARAARGGQSLTAETVLRWYTSISCGLSISQPDTPTLARLETVVRQIDTSPLRHLAAVRDVALLHLELLRRPVFPGFNGILVRLLLVSHLARHGFPPPLFDATGAEGAAAAVARQLPELILMSYDFLLGG